MQDTPLKTFFRDRGLGTGDVAKKVGMDYGYVSSLLNGSTKLTDSAKAKLFQVWPELAPILFPAVTK